MGLKVDIRKMTTDSLYNDIRTMLNDRRYEVEPRKLVLTLILGLYTLSLESNLSLNVGPSYTCV